MNNIAVVYTVAMEDARLLLSKADVGFQPQLCCLLGHALQVACQGQ